MDLARIAGARWPHCSSALTSPKTTGGGHADADDAELLLGVLTPPKGYERPQRRTVNLLRSIQVATIGLAYRVVQLLPVIVVKPGFPLLIRLYAFDKTLGIDRGSAHVTKTNSSIDQVAGHFRHHWAGVSRAKAFQTLPHGLKAPNTIC